MKIRTGFVSNSSSSSFVFITTAENHDRVMDILEQEEEFQDDILSFENRFVEATFAGIDIVSIADISVMDNSKLREERLWDIWQKYKKLAKQNPRVCFEDGAEDG